MKLTQQLASTTLTPLLRLNQSRLPKEGIPFLAKISADHLL